MFVFENSEIWGLVLLSQPGLLGPVTLNPGLPPRLFMSNFGAAPSMQPRVPKIKKAAKRDPRSGLGEPALSWPDPSAQGGELPGPAGGRIVREEIKCDHGVDLPRCDELGFAL